MAAKGGAEGAKKEKEAARKKRRGHEPKAGEAPALVRTVTPGRRAQALGADDRIGLLRTMLNIRAFEDQVHQSFLEGLVHGTTHLCQGQEAVSAGVVKALRADDYLTYTYRGHGPCIARGMSMEAAFAELFGRTTGVCQGLGGSMHLTDPELGLIGCFAIVGAGLPVATGAAMSAKLAGDGRVSATFFGDGAANIGAFHESLNLASVWRLPVIFVCENNLYGEYTRIDRSTPFEDLARRAGAYAMPGLIVDGNDALAVFEAASEAAERARAGGGPSLIECKTYRQRGHSRTDPAKYRAPEELEEWLSRDPIPRLRDRLVAEGVLSAPEAEAMARESAEAARRAAAAAAAAPWPEPRDFLSETYA